MTQYLVQQADDPIGNLAKQIDKNGPVEVIAEGELVAVIISPEDYRQINRNGTNRPKSTTNKQDFWESVVALRKRFRLDEIDPYKGDMSDAEFDEIFDNLRDKSPGREIEL